MRKYNLTATESCGLTAKRSNRLFIAGLIALAVSATALTSCSWIKEDTSDQFVATNIGDSKQDADILVTGVYSKWLYDMFCWGYFPRMLEFDADYISGPDWLFGTFGAGNFQGEPDLTDALWKGCYGLIGRANNAEQQIATMKNLTDKEKNNAIGELRFQKAFAYFLLVRAYGEIPIQNDQMVNEQMVNNIGLPRKPISEVYDYIIAQLESAAGLLYKNTDAAYQAGHVSAGSAAGLLAKVYATEASYAMPVGTPLTIRSGAPYTTDDSGNKQYTPLQTYTLSKQAVTGYESLDPQALYQQAANWAEALIDGTYGSYELLDYDKLWTKANATASEFLFSIGTISGDAKYKTAVHTQYEGYKTATGSDFIQSGGWTGCTRHWYDLFDHDDYRITKGVKHRWRVYTQEASNSGFFYPLDEEYSIMATGKDLDGNWVKDPEGIFADGVNYYYSADAQCLAFTTKYEDVTDDAIENADANWPFLRLADVLLIYAEALNELDKPADAIIQLNKVRMRANANRASMGGKKALTTKEARRSAIIEERAKELACEADRRWDLLRWGIYLDAMNIIGAYDDGGVNKTRTARNLLFPIPQQEINTNKSINTNNPGWN
ncbi:MAG: RagB/SusD family nutrient uptake outer membrane protein [Paludibacteraceae bacterium]|nr:RagB/SusD family nutrient uptake outer membrane protein [Paludibacteraceae bacterium]